MRWKPSKGLVMGVLAILLVYNLVTLVVAFFQTQTRYVAPIIPHYNVMPDGPHFWHPEATWWITEMDRIDNSPRMIAVERYPKPPELNPSDEVWLYDFKLKRMDDDVRLSETGEILVWGSSTVIYRYDLLKNLLVPWLLEKRPYSFRNEGAFENLIIVETLSGNEVMRWENLDFVLVRGIKGFIKSELSPWGPIHFVIVFGALIYVAKRW